jgi:serine/threonine-protein kinase
LLVQNRGDRALDPLIGSTLDGRYRILRVLGEGGMGIVYEAEHTLIERRVAVKVLREDFCQRSDVVERFRREAKSASRIGHPNIVDVLDFGETPTGASYFVMEMLQGEDLADVLARQGALSPERAVLIVYQCCHALSSAHDKGIVHRDLKPENIFLIEREGIPDFVKIVDFGVAKMSDLEFDMERASGHAKLTRTGMIFGTPEYMSPEQATGLPPDHRVDIYALGITLYELLTGRVPFEGESFMSVLSKHASKQVPALRDVNPRVKISPQLEQAVFQALRKDRTQRFQQMREMALALQQTAEMPALPFRLSLPSPIPAPARSLPQGTSGLVPPPPAGFRAMSPLPQAPSGPVAWPELRSAAWARVRWASALVALVATAAFVYGARGRGGSGLPPAQLGSAQAPSAEVVHARSTASEPTAREPAHADDGLDLVTVRVSTQPAGARVRLAGGGEVCATTPCSFDVVRGAPISLLARRGGYQALATLNPTAATQLHLVLEAKAAKPTAIAGSDDLKVPQIFR